LNRLVIAVAERGKQPGGVALASRFFDSRDIRETYLQQFLLFLAHRLGHFVRPAREESVRGQCANARASPESLERRETAKSRE